MNRPLFPATAERSEANVTCELYEPAAFAA